MTVLILSLIAVALIFAGHKTMRAAMNTDIQSRSTANIYNIGKILLNIGIIILIIALYKAS